jgi:hypothetical protein
MHAARRDVACYRSRTETTSMLRPFPHNIPRYLVSVRMPSPFIPHAQVFTPGSLQSSPNAWHWNKSK